MESTIKALLKQARDLEKEAGKKCPLIPDLEVRLHRIIKLAGQGLEHIWTAEVAR